MKKKIFIGSLVTVLIITFVSVYIARNSGSGPVFSGGGAFTVRTGNIGRGDISASINASGITEATDEKDVYFDTPLKVKKVLKEANQKVSKGEKILDLDLGELNSQLEQLKLSRDVQAINIKKLKENDGSQNLDNLNTAVSIAKRNLENAQESYDDAKKQLDDSEEAYIRLEISNDELEAAKKALSAAKLALDNADLNYKTSLGNYDSAKSNNDSLKNNNNSDIESQEKNLEAADLKIKDLETKIEQISESMSSPMDGVISEIYVQEGAYTSNVQPAFVIINPGKLRIKAGIKEFDMKNVSVGQRVKITGDAINKEAEVTGKITSLSPAAKKSITSGREETVIEAFVSIDQSDADIKAGLNVNCEVFTSDKKDVLIADFEMIKEDKDGNKFVYVVGKDNVMRQRQIKLGVNSDMKAEVASGLSEREAVVLNPLPSYKDGAKVRVLNVSKSEEK